MFASREEAGKLLGEKLRQLFLKRAVVLGITRGGVVVAAEVAKVLKAPLYPLVIKKISAEFNPEFALGAMGPDFATVGEVGEVERSRLKQIRKEIGESEQKFQILNFKFQIRGRTAIIVDDGIATGWTMRAAVAYAKSKVKRQKSKIIVAVPVADREIVEQFKLQFKYKKDEFKMIVLDVVDGLGAVGNHYENFGQVSDEEVKRLVDKRGGR